MSDVAPCLAVTLWSSDGALRAWEGARELLARGRPEVVQVHSWPGSAGSKKVVPLLRAALPGLRLWIGAGVDGIARQVKSGRWSVSRASREMLGIAKGARDLGAELLVWNAEAGWKTEPRTAEWARIEATVTAGLAAAAHACPGLALGFTSYDHPSYHSSFPWKAWLGPGSPVTLALPQVYASPGTGLMAHRGALPRREARALASWGRPSAPGGSRGTTPPPRSWRARSGRRTCRATTSPPRTPRGRPWSTPCARSGRCRPEWTTRGASPSSRPWSSGDGASGARAPSRPSRPAPASNRTASSGP